MSFILGLATHLHGLGSHLQDITLKMCANEGLRHLKVKPQLGATNFDGVLYSPLTSSVGLRYEVGNQFVQNYNSTLLHQKFFTDNDLEVIRHTKRGQRLEIRHDQWFEVTANGAADPDRVLMRINGIYSENRTSSFQMELNHTGDGTKVWLSHSKNIKCHGQSCGKNGLNKHGERGPELILTEMYFNGWSHDDHVRLIDKYTISSIIATCKRVGKYLTHSYKTTSN